MRRRLAYPRQAEDKPTGRLFCNLQGGLASDLEGVGAVARQSEMRRRLDSA